MAKVELDNIKLAKSACSDNVYVGILNKHGDTWINKKDITNNFIAAVIERWNGYTEEVMDSKGKKYKIIVKEIKNVD